MLRFFKGLLSRKVKEPAAEAPYKVETPVTETVVIKEDPAPVAKPKKARAPAKPRAEKKPVEKKPRAKKAK